MELYADYHYYASEYSGSSVNGNEFERYARRAQRFLDYYTQGKIETPTDKVKTALCAVVDILSEQDKINAAVPPGVKSERVDNVDITYNDNSPYTMQRQQERQIYLAILRELHGSGLLYRGG